MEYELIYKSNTFISFILNGDKYDIPQADPRFNNFCDASSNGLEIHRILNLFNEVGIGLEIVHTILARQNISSKVFKNMYLNFKNHFKMNDEEIIQLFESKLIPIDDAGFFYISSGNIKSKASIPINDSLFCVLDLICHNKSFLDMVGINQSKKQKKIAELIVRDSNAEQKIIFLLLKLVVNVDVIESILDSKTIFITNKKISDLDVVEVKDMLMFCYENKVDRIVNHLKINKVDLLYMELLEKYKSLKKHNRIEKKKYASIDDLCANIHKQYKLLISTIEYIGLQDKHKILRKEFIDKINGYEIVFPQSNAQVIEWGNEFSNCYSSRVNGYNSGEILLFGLKSEDQLEYITEFVYSDNVLRDFEGRIVSGERIYPSSELRSLIENYIVSLTNN